MARNERRSRARRSAGLLALLAACGLTAACTGPNPAFQGAVTGLDAGDGRGDGAPADRLAPVDGPPAEAADQDGPPAPPPDTGGPMDGGGPATDGPATDGPLPPDGAGPLPDGPLAADTAADTAPPDTAPPRDAPPDTAPPADAPVDLPPDTAPVTARYNFETSVQSWQELRVRAVPPVITRSMDRAWDGQYSLRVDLRSTTAANTHSTIGIAQAFRNQLPARTTISFRVWIPSGSGLEYVQPFVLYFQPGDADNDPGWGGIDPVLFTTQLRTNAWNLITHAVPADADNRGVVELGMEFVLRTNSTATVYIDAVTW